VSYRVVISAEARRQIEAVFDYIREAASPRVARRFTEAIVDQIAKLEDFPLRGSPRDDILPGLRTLGFRKRVTIAFVVEAAEVSILGVFYGGQDFETLLRDD
jgi:plasmid stabilization system protein ParE